jgi:hypothetical protein
MMVNNELARMWKEAFMAYFEVLMWKEAIMAFFRYNVRIYLRLRKITKYC